MTILCNSLVKPAEPRRVLILQRILPPYRLAFFQALARSPILASTVAFGWASKESALESLADPPNIEICPVFNAYLGKREQVIFQSGSLPLVRSGRYDTVIAEFNPRILTNVFACLYAWRHRIKFIWWGHGFRPKSSPLDRWAYLLLANLATAVIFYSKAGADGMVREGLPREKAFIAWNSIDIEEIQRLDEAAPPEERTRVLYIGRLIAEKKVALLLHSFAAAAPNLDPKTKLTLIGDGPELEGLRHLAGQLAISSKVEFVGSLYEQAKLAPYFNTAWASVSPGYIGLSAVHSLAYGVPMIVADQEPHSPEIVAIEAGVNSLFFTSDDSASLSKALLELASDPDRRTRMGLAARWGVRERFGLDGMVKAFEEAIYYAHQ